MYLAFVFPFPGRAECRELGYYVPRGDTGSGFHLCADGQQSLSLAGRGAHQPWKQLLAENRKKKGVFPMVWWPKERVALFRLGSPVSLYSKY